MAESAFHPRNEWGGTTPSGGVMRGKKRYVVIHHTAADGEPDGFVPARWKALERGEQRGGYSSLAYHFGVPKGGGHIVESRGWGNRGAATGGTAPNGQAWNDTSYAIVIDGFFHPPPNDQPTDACLESAADVIALGALFGFIDPGFELWAHRDASRGTKWATACPGDRLYPVVGGWYGSIVLRAKQKIQGAGDLGVTPPPAAPSPPRCVNVASRRTLSRGNRGPSVKTLQNLLRARGFDPGPSDGVFGKRTQDAAACFQRAAGLRVDGIVGPATWAALGA